MLRGSDPGWTQSLLHLQYPTYMKTTDTMAVAEQTDEGAWAGMENMVDDPEEVKVIFCALDSFS